MIVETWIDVVCPWCYLGKRRLEHAIGLYGGSEGIDLAWRSFQLDPDAPGFGSPGAGRPSAERLIERGYDPEQLSRGQRQLTEMAAAEGLDYHLDRSMAVNTLDAHRLIKAAATPDQAGELVESLFRAQFVEGRRIDDPETLAGIAAEAGLDDPASAQSEANAEAVRADIAEAARLGARGVPFFVLDRRFAVAGAQPVEMLVGALERAAGDAG